MACETDTQSIKVSFLPEKISSKSLSDYFQRFGLIINSLISYNLVEEVKQIWAVITFSHQHAVHAILQSAPHIVLDIEIKTESFFEQINDVDANKSLNNDHCLSVTSMSPTMTMGELVTMFMKCGEAVYIRRGQMDGSFIKLDWAQIHFKDKPLSGKLDDIDFEDVIIDTQNLPNKKKCEKYYAYTRPESCAVYIDGLKDDILRSELKAYFSKFGKLRQLVWIFNAATMTWNNWAIVEFKDKPSRDLALDKNQHQIKSAMISTRTCLQNEKIIASDFPNFIPNIKFVNGIISGIKKNSFESCIGQFGELMKIRLHVSTDSSPKENFATVDYADPRDVISALNQEENEVDSMPIRVQKGVEIPSCFLKDRPPEPLSVMLWGLNNRLTYVELRRYFSRFGHLIDLHWDLEDGVRRCQWACLFYNNRKGADRVLDYGVHIIKSVRLTPSMWYFKQSHPQFKSNAKKIYLKDLDKRISASKISVYFMQFGEIIEVYKKTAYSDWATVTFGSTESVDKILDVANHHIAGIRLQCVRCQAKNDLFQLTAPSINNLGGDEFDENSVFTGRLYKSITELLLREYFEQFGTVSKIVIRETEMKKKWSIVSFDDSEAVRRVLLKNEHMICSTITKVWQGYQLKRKQPSTNTFCKDEIDDYSVFMVDLHKLISECLLRDYFEQFGTVSKILIGESEMGQKWSIVSFDDLETVRRVLLKNEHKIGSAITTVRQGYNNKSKPREGEIDDYSVFMGGLHELITERLLREYFEQFGTVSKILIGETEMGRKWSVVSFDDPESVQRVLLKNKHKIGDTSTSVRQAQKPKSKPPSTNTFSEGEIDDCSVFLVGLNEWITERLLREYFEQFGNVSQLVIRENDNGQTWSIVRFDDPEPVRRVLLKNEHKIGDTLTKVRQGYKNKIKPPSTNLLHEGEIDDYSVFMGSLHELITERLLREYFVQFGTVTEIVIRENNQGQTWSIVSFDDPEAVQLVLRKNEHKICDTITTVRQGYKNKRTISSNASMPSTNPWTRCVSSNASIPSTNLCTRLMTSDASSPSTNQWQRQKSNKNN